MQAQEVVLEAVTGDRVAVMRDGRLVQYSTPAELLANPVDDFVADFVGADRALKSLSLTRLEDIELLDAPLVTEGEPLSAVRERVASGALSPVEGAVLVVDARGRPLDWLPLARLDGADAVPSRPPGGAEPLVDRLTTLRDALSAILRAASGYGTVVDGAGRCVGLVGAAEIVTGYRRVATPARAGG